MDGWRRAFPILALAGVVLLGSCSSESDGDDGAGGGATSGGTCGAQGETFSAGMTKEGDQGLLTFVLVSSDPAPPGQDYNTWTIEVREGATPLEGATILVEARMPGHNHAPEPVSVTDLGGGRYELAAIALFMVGVWNIKITATSASGTADSVTFCFDIQG